MHAGMHTLHYITLQYITLHYITLHDITLHYIHIYIIIYIYPMDPWPLSEKVLNPPNYSKLYPKHFLRRYLDP